MKDDRTYIKVFRKILNWEWYGDTNTFRVFMHILLRANYEPSRYMGVEVPAGACVFGRRAWAEELGMSERQVRTAIEHLKSTNEITIKSTNKFSVITLVKWEFWQIEEGKATSRTTSKKANERPTNDQQPTTSKESKKVRNTTTPTIEEVREYVRENNLIVDPDYFYKYYQTAEWKDAKGKDIKNWKLKLLNWNRREEERSVQHDSRRSSGERFRISGTTQQSQGSSGRVSAKLPPVAPELLSDE